MEERKEQNDGSEGEIIEEKKDQYKEFERKVYNYKNREEWLKLREGLLTSTDIAKLFNVSPYGTHFSLWHEKKGLIEDSFKSNQRTEMGKLIEPVIGQLALKHLTKKGGPLNSFISIPALRMGSSFDWAAGEEKGKPTALIEIKNVDKFVFDEKWSWHEKSGLQAPEHIELQLQYQMLVSGIREGYIAVLSGGNDFHIIYRKLREDIASQIFLRVGRFWASIDNNKKPSAMPEDSKTIIKINQEVVEGSVHPSPNTLFPQAEKYAKLKQKKKILEAEIETLKGSILIAMGTHEKAEHPKFKISAGKIRASRLVSDRPAHRNLRITWRKK